MRHKGFSLREFVVLNGVVIVLGVATFTVATRNRNAAQKATCQNNLKMITLGFQLYRPDFEGHYPPIILTDKYGCCEMPPEVPPYGWADVLQPYIRTMINNSGANTLHSAIPSIQTNICPASGRKQPYSIGNRSDPGFTDYWFNSRLAGVKHGLDKTELPHPDLTICVGDGNDGTEKNNSRYNRNSVPLNYAPARRHSGGANYAFADGHVKWLVPEAIAAGLADKNKPTLWPR